MLTYRDPQLHICLNICKTSCLGRACFKKVDKGHWLHHSPFHYPRLQLKLLDTPEIEKKQTSIIHKYTNRTDEAEYFKGWIF